MTDGAQSCTPVELLRWEAADPDAIVCARTAVIFSMDSCHHGINMGIDGNGNRARNQHVTTLIVLQQMRHGRSARTIVRQGNPPIQQNMLRLQVEQGTSVHIEARFACRRDRDEVGEASVVRRRSSKRGPWARVKPPVACWDMAYCGELLVLSSSAIEGMCAQLSHRSPTTQQNKHTI